jgi:hypothetical protein
LELLADLGALLWVVAINLVGSHLDHST